MANQIYVEKIALKPIERDGQDVPPAYCVVVDGRRSPLYFSRRQAEGAVAVALEQAPTSD